MLIELQNNVQAWFAYIKYDLEQAFEERTRAQFREACFGYER